MQWTEEQRCLLWLSAAEIPPDRVKKLCGKFGSAQGIWDAFGAAVGPAFKDKSKAVLGDLHSRQAIDGLIERLEKLNVHLLFWGQDGYPSMLCDIDDPPYLLYYAGSLSAMERPMVAVVGTREPSRYGIQMAKSIARDLAEVGIAIVSGLARGIDSAAHAGALQVSGLTVGVMGSGINVPYPSENTSLLRSIAKSGGLVLSEYPLDAEPLTYHFPHRNRIISGMCHACIFVEGKVQSGGMLTVSSALSQGRDVFAVPGTVGTIGAEGPHTIVREGARLVTCAKDILDDLALDLEPLYPQAETQPEAASGLQEAILAALRKESLGLDELCRVTGSSAQELISELSIMEIMGQIRRDVGNLFSLAF